MSCKAIARLLCLAWSFGLSVSFFVSDGARALAAELPAATQKLLTDAKLPASMSVGIDHELAVPKVWEEGARREGGVRFSSTFSPTEFRNFIAPFRDRYPFIKVDYSKATAQQRETSILVAYKEGRYVADVISSYSGAYKLFVEAQALDDLRGLPGFLNLGEASRSPQGFWVAYRRQFYCTAYNTNLVQASELPQRWEDILTNPIWRNGNIGIGNIPQLWLLPLWGTNGESFVRDYIQRFFGVVRPQLRKEGASALVSLVVAGEFRMSIPASEYRVQNMVAKGAPVSFHCPDPVPASEPRMSILRGNPHPNAARLLTNWIISKEGQISLHSSTGSPPVHKDLQRGEFVPFPEVLLGRNYAIRTDDILEEAHPKLLALWNEQWLKVGGSPGAAGREDD